MAEYITKEQVIEWFRPYGHTDEGVTYYGLVTDIREMKAAEVAPVAHGRWDDIPNTYVSVASKDGAYHGNATTCSACHEVNPNAYKTNYCPNCGAKMDGGDDDVTYDA